jgi:hypothetical protein
MLPFAGIWVASVGCGYEFVSHIVKKPETKGQTEGQSSLQRCTDGPAVVRHLASFSAIHLSFGAIHLLASFH